ncbi:cell division initiation protein [Desulfotomaculum arcticum]|uniref:Cell division initiation protein n=1 Tax=Desulfotruncus arcticus DSM 17038 TaxID=1121424 RepID=A0A1I2STX9_9FIRM|nr:DivIVA domain-containing protein [Desulfotruncus arcticus]SFG56182.1 cell division initiation protein [Desulfotomaculum arcticum] [Desulfotruncus arcticus DSM 17038]
MLTPLDIQKKEFKRAFRGYNQDEVDQFLDQLVRDYELLYIENQSLKEKLEASETAKARYLEMEKIIKDAVIMAQKNADDLTRNARQQADMIAEDARLNAEKIIGEAESKAGQALQEARERARFRIKEAEERVQTLLDEYRFLEKQTSVFRVKFRSFLEAQLELLDGQQNEAQELLAEAGLGLFQAAASIENAVVSNEDSRKNRETGIDDAVDDENK